VSGVLALTSAKHSPGVTTAALALAVAAGPQPVSLVVEADPAGGDLGACCGLALEPGLGSLAASARHGAPVDVAAHAQVLPASPFALLAPTSPCLVTGALDSLGPRLPEALADWNGTVVIDCGRWQSDWPTANLVASADTLLVVLRPTVEGVEHVHARLDDLQAAGAGTLAALLVGDRPYRPAEVGAVLGLPVAGVLAWDPRAARALEHHVIGAETLRSTVVRSARSTLDTMAKWPSARAGMWA
jgi:MinD-like ATPase involved in chromosome partitioning or flagellar assembly